MPGTIAIDGFFLDTHRLALAIAVLLAFALMRLLARYFDVPPDRVERIGILVLLSGAVAGRAAFAAAHWAAYRDTPWSVLYFWRDGFNTPVGVLVAAAVAALVLGVLHARRAGAYAPPVVLGLAGPAALFGAFLAFPTIAGNGPQLVQGDAVPALHMVDLNGNPTSLADYRGHPVILNIWATWCTPCRQEIPMLSRAFMAHREEGLRVIGADRGEPRQRIASFEDSTSMPYMVWMDPGQSAAQSAPSARLLDQIGAPGLPATLFIDADGTVRSIHIGQLHQGSLAHGLDRILPTDNARAAQSNPGRGRAARREVSS